MRLCAQLVSEAAQRPTTSPVEPATTAGLDRHATMPTSAYSLLGVKPTATSDEIRNAYKEKAMLNHPDRGGSAAIWAELQKAYDTLSDPQRRSAYDKNMSVSGSAEKQFAEGFAGQEAKKPAMSISKQVGEFKGERIYMYTLIVDPDGLKTKPILLFLHGYAASAVLYYNMYKDLSEQFTIIAVDQIGMGASS